MNGLKIFRNSEFGEVRTLGVNGEPYFIGTPSMEAIILTFLDFFKKYVFFFIFIYIHIEKNRFIGSIGYKVNKFNT